MIRSLLLVPGNSIRSILQAQDTEADALILDLEEGISPEQKEEARGTVARLVREIDFGEKELFVRINGLGTPWGMDDARAVVAGGVRGIVIPKLEQVDEVTAVAAILEGRLHRESDCRRSRILGLLETPRGIFQARSLADANGLMAGLLFGASHLAAVLRSEPSEGEPELLMARSQLLLAARAAGIEAYDSPAPTLEDSHAVRRYCRASRQMGYDGKVALDPAQLQIIHDLFSLRPERIEEAAGILAAMEEAHTQGWATGLYRGRMIDPIDAAEAKRLLTRTQRPVAMG
jgi:citrate lyase subunit beta/citryl-CoA lyase